jgi:hypothetical protein
MERLKLFLPKNTTTVIQSTNQGITQACKAYYHSGLLRGAVNSELQVGEFLKTLTLKDVAAKGLG